jgi:hypothetical protein
LRARFEDWSMTRMTGRTTDLRLPGAAPRSGTQTETEAGAAAASRPRGRKVLAVASGGGHWMQLRRIVPAFAGLEVVYASVDPAPPADLADCVYYRLRDATRRDRLAFAVLAAQLARIVLRERPDVVITTGAAPGLLALALAKGLVRSRTVWIDSIANVERLSSSGLQARRVADVWLTQWPHLAGPDGSGRRRPEHWGAVL